MGGGDLNSKKAWHPNNLKNQERVWKAEQAAAEEKKRIMELQKERAEERDREELNDIVKRTAGGSNSSENRLHWMYDKPDKKVQHEDYLLGKSIDSKYGNEDKHSQDIIPAVARRVVGSSMLGAMTDTQVDLVRKQQEDPLLLIKERERAARAALLNNPLQRKRLTELLRKEQEQSKKKKEEKMSKKKGKDLDDILAAKLNALGATNNLDLKTLLASDNSSDSSDSSNEDKVKNKKKKDKKKKKKKKKEKDSKCRVESSDEEVKHSKKVSKKTKDKDKKTEKPKNKRKSEDDYYDDLVDAKKQRYCDTTNQTDDKSLRKHLDDVDRKRRRRSPEHESSHRTDEHLNTVDEKQRKRSPDDDRHDRPREHPDQDRKQRHRTPDYEQHRRRYNERDECRSKSRAGMSKKEKAAKLAEMAAAGAEREVQRGRRVAQQLAEKEESEKPSNSRHYTHNEARALPDSLESRIHSNRHYIQRDRRHMNEHFARR